MMSLGSDVKNLNAVASNVVCQVPKYVCPCDTDADITLHWVPGK